MRKVQEGGGAVKVLVFGSRAWTDRVWIRDVLRKLPAGTVIVHGAARGADRIAGEVAAELRFQVRPYPADWVAHGKSAGPIRNAMMLSEEHPDKEGIPLDFALCFHEDPGLGKGSADMRGRCLKAGLPCKVFLAGTRTS